MNWKSDFNQITNELNNVFFKDIGIVFEIIPSFSRNSDDKRRWNSLNNTEIKFIALNIWFYMLFDIVSFTCLNV